MNRELFQAGFIAGLADRGYTPTEFEEKLEKTALFGAVGWLIPAAVAAGALGLGGAKLLGRGAGRAVQTLTEPSEADIEIAKKEEEVERYTQLIAEAKRRAAEQARAQIPGTV